MHQIHIDTTSNKEIIVSLKSNQQEFTIKRELVTHKAQIVLPTILQLLSEHSLSLGEITAITVNAGPGSFTGVRVGVAVANSLAYALNIPVNGRMFTENTSLVEPTYTA